MRRTAPLLMAAMSTLAIPAFAQAATAGQPDIDTGTTAWMLTSTALVLLMVPGLAMFYGGLVRTKNVLGTMMHCFAAMAIIGTIWVVCGYALAFGPDVFHGWIGWDSHLVFLKSLDIEGPGAFRPVAHESGKVIPYLVYAMFQGKFAIIAPALIAGAFAERIRFRGYCLFITLWCLTVYCPLCHSVWGPGGYLASKHTIDFAGGIVVHLSAGVSALVAALYLGARRGYPHTAMHPNNLVMTLIGAGLLWVGWFGFNAGSAVSSGFETARALTVTQIAAAAGALGWMAIEGLRHRKVSSLGMVSGIIAGLGTITPGARVVTPEGAVILGLVAALVCYLAIEVKTKLGYDDSLDVFGIHGMTGFLGVLCLSFFIRPAQLLQMHTTHWHQFLVQAYAVAIATVGCAVISLLLLVLVEKTVGLRLSEDDEMAGMDHALHGEYGFGLLNPN